MEKDNKKSDDEEVMYIFDPLFRERMISKRGFKTGVNFVVKKMLEEKVDIEVISRVTGYTSEEVEKVRVAFDIYPWHLDTDINAIDVKRLTENDINDIIRRIKKHLVNSPEIYTEHDVDRIDLKATERGVYTATRNIVYKMSTLNVDVDLISMYTGETLEKINTMIKDYKLELKYVNSNSTH